MCVGVRQPPTLPLFELVFAASTARSMGLLTRVGICVRPHRPWSDQYTLSLPPHPLSLSLSLFLSLHRLVRSLALKPSTNPPGTPTTLAMPLRDSVQGDYKVSTDRY